MALSIWLPVHAETSIWHDINLKCVSFPIRALGCLLIFSSWPWISRSQRYKGQFWFQEDKSKSVRAIYSILVQTLVQDHARCLLILGWQSWVTECTKVKNHFWHKTIRASIPKLGAYTPERDSNGCLKFTVLILHFVYALSCGAFVSVKI